jgi:hypothetical protein
VHPGHFGSDLRAAQNIPDLGTVAVTNGDIPALFDHIGNVQARLFGSLILAFHSDMLVIPDQGIPTDGDDCEFCHRLNLLQ